MNPPPRPGAAATEPITGRRNGIRPPPTGLARDVGEALTLEEITPGGLSYRAAAASADDPRGLYGGLITAQALRAASLTVPPDRIAHSVHGYFLVPGNATLPIVYDVEELRDGRLYSTRRIVATQDGRSIFTLDASFQTRVDGPDYQATEMPSGPSPRELAPVPQDPRMLDLEVRVPPDDTGFHRWPTRLWIRIAGRLADDANLRACGLVFVSDMCTGLSRAPQVEKVGILPSIDHAVWLHRDVDPNGWMLMDLEPQSTSHGRGMYSGRIFDEEGVLLANLAQESLFTIRRKR